jgi:hypothetical protein
MNHFPHRFRRRFDEPLFCMVLLAAFGFASPNPRMVKQIIRRISRPQNAADALFGHKGCRNSLEDRRRWICGGIRRRATYCDRNASAATPIWRRARINWPAILIAHLWHGSAILHSANSHQLGGLGECVHKSMCQSCFRIHTASQSKLPYAFLAHGAVPWTISWPFPQVRDESYSTCNHQAIRTRPFAA